MTPTAEVQPETVPDSRTDYLTVQDYLPVTYMKDHLPVATMNDYLTIPGAYYDLSVPGAQLDLTIPRTYTPHPVIVNF